MDVSKPIEDNKLFSFNQVRQTFEDFQNTLRKDLAPKEEMLTNLCRLSACEFAILARSVLPLPSVQPIELMPVHASWAISKTDTTLFRPCSTAQRLPTKEADKLRITDFVLFSGDVDKITPLWSEYKTSLIEDTPYERLLTDMTAKYKSSMIPNQFRMADVAANRLLPLQALIWRLKLDLCLGTSDELVIRHFNHARKYL